MADTVATEPPSSGGWTHKLWQALDVRAGEIGLVAWACALFFATLASGSIGLNVADALFFLRFGVDHLPLMIMASGVSVMVVTIAYAAGLGALGARRWSWMMPASFAGWLVVERIAVGLDIAGIYPAIWLTSQVIIYVSFTLLWDVAGGLVNARQAKRLFPLFTSAGIAGAVTGNALTGPLANLLGTENLLVVQSATMAIAGFFAYSTASRFLGRTKRGARMIISDLRSGLTITMQVPLFRLVAGVGALISVLFFLVFMPFSAEAAASFRSEADLAGFLGFFSSIATAATFLVSLLFANRVFTRIGVVAVLMVVAIVYVAGFATWLVSFGLVTATLFRGLQWVAVNALGNTAFNSLFNVLTGPSRSQVRDFVNAVPMQLGTVAAGAILLLSTNLSSTSMTILSLVVAVAFLMLVLPMRRAYADALVDGLRNGLAGIFTAETHGLQKPLCDADALAALSAGLADPEPGHRRVAAAILGEVGSKAACSSLANAVDDEDAAVRLTVLESLANIDAGFAAVVAPQGVGDADARIRLQALRLITLDNDTDSIIRRASEDDDAFVRAQAARLLCESGGPDTIAEMLASGDERQVEAAIRAIADEPRLGHVDATDYADDGNRRIRAAAARVAGAAHAIDTLHTMLNDESATVRTAAANEMAALPEGTAAIRATLMRGTVNAREAALSALSGREDAKEFLHSWASDEIERAAALHACRRAIQAADEPTGIAAGYLASVLELRERMIERWVVLALSTEETSGALRLISRAAISGDRDLQAGALEALESLTDRRLAHRFGELMDDSQSRTPANNLDALRILSEDTDIWLRSLARRALEDELPEAMEGPRRLDAKASNPVVLHAVAVAGEEITDSMPSPEPNTVDVVLDLQRCLMFRGIDPETLERIVPFVGELAADPGDVIYEQGEVADRLFVVVEGAAHVCQELDGSVIAEAGPGELVGELGVLRNSPRMARVIAGPDGLHASTFDGPTFLQLLEDQPALSSALLTTLAERLAVLVET